MNLSAGGVSADEAAANEADERDVGVVKDGWAMESALEEASETSDPAASAFQHGATPGRDAEEDGGAALLSERSRAASWAIATSRSPSIGSPLAWASAAAAPSPMDSAL